MRQVPTENDAHCKKAVFRIFNINPERRVFHRYLATISERLKLFVTHVAWEAKALGERTVVVNGRETVTGVRLADFHRVSVGQSRHAQYHDQYDDTSEDDVNSSPRHHPATR
jgi:hypothetical protein